MKPDNLTALCDTATQLAVAAGEVIMPIYARFDVLDVQKKADQSPVTAADLAAHTLIVDGLSAAFPHIPILSEEAAEIDFETRSTWTTYWLIDPLDGTREFLKGNGDFTVNIALIHEHEPILGVVYAPVFNLLFSAIKGESAYRIENNKKIAIQTRKADMHALTVATSRSHSQENVPKMTKNLPNCKIIPMGSSLKTCTVAEGSADIYPRFGPTSEWDTAASECILEAAGGCIMDVTGAKLRYNSKPSLLNPWFIAVGDQTKDWIAQIPDELKVKQ